MARWRRLSNGAHGISFRPICFGARERDAQKDPDGKVRLKARTPCVDVSGRSPPLGPRGHWSLYENGSFGEKSELALVAARRVAFFLSFFDFRVGFFATLDFLVFLAIVVAFRRAGSGDQLLEAASVGGHCRINRGLVMPTDALYAI